jgi:signal-transduction protein with cAMP-binding, CBS, and nucleotidyltransferase domain
VLQRVVEPNRDPGATAVHEVMTPKPRTIKAGERVSRVLDVMARGKFRHLPVLDGAEVVGVLSMRDLNAWLIRKLASKDDTALALAKSMGAVKPVAKGRLKAV